MQMDVEIWTVEEGKVKEIKVPQFDNKIFVIREQVKAIVGAKKFNSHNILDKGKLLGHVSKASIYENILNELMKSPESGYLDIFRKYNPKYKYETYQTMKWAYKKYMRGHGIAIDTSNPVKRSYKKRKSKPSSNCVAFNKKYGTWIKEEDLQKTKIGLTAVGYGYKPTSKAISIKTGLRVGRVNATLDYLLDQNLVRRKYEDETYVYELI